MKKLHLFATGLLIVGVIAGGAVAAQASGSLPDRPAWVTADGKADLSKMPDNARIPYQCWNGRTVTLEGRTIKQREKSNALPGSAEHTLGVAKMKELRQIPGVVSFDSQGGEVVTIDDTDPRIQKVMEKYEAKENPQCR
jgi:hypothetical protein